MELLDQPWPEVDPLALVQDDIELVVQVNGKLRAQIRVPKEADRTTIEQMALDHAHIQKTITGQSVKKIIVIPGRLVNIVV
jgi:leucyl-tRNA synthetase